MATSFWITARTTTLLKRHSFSRRHALVLALFAACASASVAAAMAGQKDQAGYAKLKAANPELAAKYAYLGKGESDGTRAADVAATKGDVLWQD